jgi:membrane-bound lytic murein transglycosylase B
MMLRKRLIPVAALVVAIGASAAGAATAAETTGTGKTTPVSQKKTEVVSLDKIAAKLGVSKATLVQALEETKQWIIASPTKPSVAQFEQHLAGLLHVPVAELAAVLK